MSPRGATSTPLYASPHGASKGISVPVGSLSAALFTGRVFKSGRIEASSHLLLKGAHTRRWCAEWVAPPFLYRLASRLTGRRESPEFPSVMSRVLGRVLGPLVGELLAASQVFPFGTGAATPPLDPPLATGPRGLPRHPLWRCRGVIGLPLRVVTHSGFPPSKN